MADSTFFLRNILILDSVMKSNIFYLFSWDTLTSHLWSMLMFFQPVLPMKLGEWNTGRPTEIDL